MRFARDSAGYWLTLVVLGLLLFAGFELVDEMQVAMRTEVGRVFVGVGLYGFVVWLIAGWNARGELTEQRRARGATRRWVTRGRLLALSSRARRSRGPH